MHVRDPHYRYSKDGLVYERMNKSIIVSQFGQTKPGIRLTDDEKTRLGGSIMKYLSDIENVKKDFELTSSRLYTRDSFCNFKGKSILKFTPFPIARFKFNEGNIKLGSLDHYRKIENEKSRDVLEGFSFYTVSLGNSEVNLTMAGGFDYLIFCGTTVEISPYEFKWLQNQFGSSCIQIYDVQSFADEVCKTIHAKEYFISEIHYTNSKTVSSDLRKYNFNPDYFDIIGDNFEFFLKETSHPSLFLKPEAFKSEKEIRIAFRLGENSRQSFTTFKNRKLLKFYTPINDHSQILQL